MRLVEEKRVVNFDNLCYSLILGVESFRFWFWIKISNKAYPFSTFFDS